MNRPLFLSLTGLAVATVAIALALYLDVDGEGEAVPEPPAASVPMPALAPAPVPREEPSFDVVRVDGEGDAVIAGRAMPGAIVTVLDGETVLGKVQADTRGEWVFVPEAPLAPGAIQLNLRADNADGRTTRSAAPVVVIVPERGAGAALAVGVLPDGGVRLFQGAGRAGQLSIDMVDLDRRGRLQVSGHGPAGARLRVYLDDKPVGTAEAGADGVWHLAVKGAGGHRLRADRLGEADAVAERVEVALPPDTGAEPAGDGQVVVEKGTSLWRIARRRYGAGVAYTLLFSANKDQIRDPDRIYPGQVLSAPRR